MPQEPGAMEPMLAIELQKCSSLNLIGQLASGDRSGSSVGWRSGGDHLLLCERDGVKEGLHRGLPEAPPTLMRPVLVVAPDPLIKVGLQLGDRAVDPLAEGHPVELVQHRLVEALNDAVRLWAFGLGAGVIHIL